MPWGFFVLGYEEFNRSRGCFMVVVTPIDELNESVETPLGSERFAELVSATQDRKAAVAHDKIFEVIGIPTRVKFALKVDYSMHLDQIYTAVTRFCVDEDNTPGILDSVCGRVESNLLSWVVDFSTDFIVCGHNNVEFGQLSSLSRSESCLNLYCFVLGFYVPGDERLRRYHNSRDPDFRPLSDYFFHQISSKTGLDPPLRITMS